MDVKQICSLSGLELVDVEMVRATMGEEHFTRVLGALDNVVTYARRARGRGIDDELLRFNVIYHLIRLYSVTLAKNEGDRENVGRGLIKQIIYDESLRTKLYEQLFDTGGVHEKLTTIKRPA